MTSLVGSSCESLAACRVTVVRAPAVDDVGSALALSARAPLCCDNCLCWSYVGGSRGDISGLASDDVEDDADVESTTNVEFPFGSDDVTFGEEGGRVVVCACVCGELLLASKEETQNITDFT